jgi:hypothetical protein
MFTDIEPSPKMYEEFKVVLDILSYYLWWIILEQRSHDFEYEKPS